MKQTTLSLVIAALLGALSATARAAEQPPADGSVQVIKQTAPGKGAIAHVQKIVATVEAIDAQQRQVTLKGPKGKLVDLAVGPDVHNLEQVKVGDKVTVAYAEALSLELKKNGKALRSAAESASGARASEGERPAGVIVQQVKVTADVTAVNKKTHLVTLRGPKQTVDLYVADPEQLKLIKVGDQVEAVYAQAEAISVEPAAPAKVK